MAPVRAATGSVASGGGVPLPGSRRHRRGFLRRHLLSIVLTPLVAGILAALLSLLLAPVYEASGTLVLDADPRIDEGLETQVLMIRSRALANRVAARLEPSSRAAIETLAAGAGPGWIPDRLVKLRAGAEPRQETDTREQARRRLVEGLAAGLRVESVGGSRVVRIAFRSGDPRLSGDVVDTYLDSIETLGIEERTRSTGRLEALRGKLEAAESRLSDYRGQHGLPNAERPAGISAAERDASARRLVAARAERDRLQAELDQLDGIENAEPAAAAAHPLLARDPVIQALRTDEVRADQAVANLALRYGELHPKMIAARAELESIRSRLAAEISSAVETIAQSLASAESRVKEMEPAREARPSRVELPPEQQEALRERQREVEIDRARYEQAMAGIEGPGAGRSAGLVIAHILDRPGVPGEPAAPNRLAIVAAAILAGLLLGIARASIRDLGDERIRSPEDLADRVGTPLLATVPKLHARHAGPSASARCFAERPRSDFAEAIRTLRTALLLATPDDAGQVIVVTASLPGEGASTLAANLAGALARNAQVLLIDADLRQGGMAARLGLPGQTPGLAELLIGTDSVDDCIQRAESIGVDLIGAGDLPPDPLELLSSKGLEDALSELRRRYDRIVVDSPPLDSVSDALILSAAASSILLVIRAGATSTALARLSLDRLRRAGAPILGAALNG